jgi:hypothetical protein
VLHGRGNVHNAGAPHATVDELLRPLLRQPSPMPFRPPVLNTTMRTLACAKVTMSVLLAAKSSVLATWNRSKIGTYKCAAEARQMHSSLGVEIARLYPRKNAAPEGFGALVLSDTLGSAGARSSLREKAACHRSCLSLRMDQKERAKERVSTAIIGTGGF